MPTRGTGLGSDIGSMGVQGDELMCQVGRHRCGGVGANDHYGLVLQGRDDLGNPGDVLCLRVCSLSLASTLVIPACFRSAGAGQASMTSRVASCSRLAPHHPFAGRVDLGERLASDPV